MTSRPLLAVFVALLVGGCGSDTGESTPSAAGDELIAMQQPPFPGGTSAEPLIISPRTYTNGTVTVKVTGFFDADGSQTLNVPASLTDEDQTWLQYGISGAPELNVLFTNSQSMAEHGVTVGLGPNSVTTTSTSGECRTQVDVTPTLVTGNYSCTGSTGYNSQTSEMGEVEVEVEFSAGS